MSLLPLVFASAMLVSCSKKRRKPSPSSRCRPRSAQRGAIQQIISAEAILFPHDQAAITPKIVAPVKTFYVNRGSRVHRGQLLAVLENRDLAAAEVENKGTYEQAQATYGLETSSALPEEWQKAELDLKTAKEAYDAAAEGLRQPQRSVPAGRAAAQGARRVGGRADPGEGAIRNRREASGGAAIGGQATANEVGQGTAHLGARQVRRRCRAACLHRDSQPDRRRGHRPSQLSRRDSCRRALRC